MVEKVPREKWNRRSLLFILLIVGISIHIHIELNWIDTTEKKHQLTFSLRAILCCWSGGVDVRGVNDASGNGVVSYAIWMMILASKSNSARYLFIICQRQLGKLEALKWQSWKKRLHDNAHSIHISLKSHLCERLLHPHLSILYIYSCLFGSNYFTCLWSEK